MLLLCLIVTSRNKVQSNAVFHMSRTQFNQFSAFEPVKFDWFYLERLRRSSRLASREKRLETDSGSDADFYTSRTKRIINDNQKLSHVNVWISLKIYESASISIFSNMAAFTLSPHMLIIYAWINASCQRIYIFHQVFTIRVLETVTVNCTAGETLILPWKNHYPPRPLFLFLCCSSSVWLN